MLHIYELIARANTNNSAWWKPYSDPFEWGVNYSNGDMLRCVRWQQPRLYDYDSKKWITHYDIIELLGWTGIMRVSSPFLKGVLQ